MTSYLWPYIGSQLFSILLLWAAVKAPRLARLLFVLLFAGASCLNYVTALRTPEVYLAYAPMAITFYANFIQGWFKEHIYLMVTLIAAGQALIATGMLLKNQWVKIAVSGAVLFLLAIAPLGVGAAFPFSITVSIAALIMLKKDNLDFLWKLKKQAHYES